MRRLSWIAVVFVLLTSVLSAAMPVMADGYTVIVASDGTGDNVNVRNAPNMDATIAGLIPPGTSLRLNSTDVFTSPDGWHWLPVALSDGTSGYIRQDLVSTPSAAQSNQANPTNPYASLTSTPRDERAQMYMWAVPQSLGGYLLTHCDAFAVNTATLHSGEYECPTTWYASMDKVTTFVNWEDNRFNVTYLAAAPDPPRIYLHGVYTAVAYADNGNYLAQALDDKTATLLARIAAEQGCGQSCNIHVSYYWQN